MPWISRYWFVYEKDDVRDACHRISELHRHNQWIGGGDLILTCYLAMKDLDISYDVVAKESSVLAIMNWVNGCRR